MGPGPYTFRVTDLYGHVLVDSADRTPRRIRACRAVRSFRHAFTKGESPAPDEQPGEGRRGDSYLAAETKGIEIVQASSNPEKSGLIILTVRSIPASPVRH